MKLDTLTLGALILVSSWACSSSTGPKEELFLEGDIDFQSFSSHDIVMVNDGIAEIAIDSLTPIAVADDGTESEGIFEVIAGIRLGRRDAAGECQGNTQFTVAEGDSFFFSLRKGDHCLDLFDPGSIPPSNLLRYFVSVRIQT
jgi:hypothetical protein